MLPALRDVTMREPEPVPPNVPAHGAVPSPPDARQMPPAEVQVIVTGASTGALVALTLSVVGAEGLPRVADAGNDR